MRYIALLTLALSLHPSAWAGSKGSATVRVQAAVETKEAETQSLRVVSSGYRPIAGPMLGYMLSQDLRGVLPLEGIPGAALAGPMIELSRHAGPLALSSVGRYALAAGEPGRLVLYFLGANLRSGSAPSDSFAIGFRSDQIVLSPLGTSALLYDRKARQAMVLRGLPRRPIPSTAIPLDSLPGVLTALAVADDGSIALAAFASSDRPDTVYLLRPEADAQAVASVDTIGGLSFAPRQRDALVTDLRRNEITLLSGGGREGLTRIAGPEDGVRRPSQVAAFTDGSVLVLDSFAGAPLLLQPGERSRRVDCQCRASTLERLGKPDAIRLTGPDSAATSVIERRGGESLVYHIPTGGSLHGDGLPNGPTPLPSRGRGY